MFLAYPLVSLCPAAQTIMFPSTLGLKQVYKLRLIIVYSFSLIERTTTALELGHSSICLWISLRDAPQSLCQPQVRQVVWYWYFLGTVNQKIFFIVPSYSILAYFLAFHSSHARLDAYHHDNKPPITDNFQPRSSRPNSRPSREPFESPGSQLAYRTAYKGIARSAP